MELLSVQMFTEGREAVCMGITPLLPLAVQKFQQYFEGQLEFFCRISKLLLIYCTLSHRTSNDVLQVPRDS